MIPGALAGLRVSGLIGLSPRSLAIAFDRKPRSYLWIHLERKETVYALAGELPIPPDPRGSRYGALEEFLRGLTVIAASDRDGALTLTLAAEPRRGATHTLAIDSGGARSNLILSAVPVGTVLWAFHREPEAAHREPEAARREPEAARRGPEAAGAPPAAFHPARARAAESGEAREALAAAIERAFREDFERELARAVSGAERALRRRLEAQGGDLERARAQKAARAWGEILLAHYNEITRGASRARLPDTFADSPGATVEIPLDPALTPHENAARLFQKAKKGERGESLVEARLARTRRDLMDLAGLREAVASSPPKDALRLLNEFLGRAGLPSMAWGGARKLRLGQRAAGAPPAGRPGHRSPGARESIGPRTLRTSDGWEVWVGRNNTDNDRITHRLSNPHDFWFHVVGVPGSHVILRRPTRSALPKPRTLEEAAAIAAYFSKGRKLTRVPVIYTERKFVSKPRRGKPGQAICTRERELLVRPGIPKANAGNESEVSS